MPTFTPTWTHNAHISILVAMFTSKVTKYKVDICRKKVISLQVESSV